MYVIIFFVPSFNIHIQLFFAFYISILILKIILECKLSSSGLWRNDLLLLFTYYWLGLVCSLPSQCFTLGEQRREPDVRPHQQHETDAPTFLHSADACVLPSPWWELYWSRGGGAVPQYSCMSSKACPGFFKYFFYMNIYVYMYIYIICMCVCVCVWGRKSYFL